MKTIVLQLPDSVQLSEQELQEFVLQKLAEVASSTASPSSATVEVPAKDAAEIRHLIGLYYAEKAANLVDELWNQNGWTPETMHTWVQEHMRTPYRRRDSAA